MTNIAERVIIENFDILKKDLQDDIIMDCRDLLSLEDIHKINALDNEEAKVNEFLIIISRKPYPVLWAFISKLEDWYAWLHSLMIKCINDYTPKDQIYEALQLGGVPNLPQINIERKALLIDLKHKLRTLQKGHYVVAHGMIGSGKTSLAVDALSDNDILRSFGYQVYWLTVGREGSEDSMLLLEELNARLPDPLPHLSTNIRHAAIELNKRFVSKKWTESLIVLDDVTSESVLDCFNIAAKFLITTKDMGIIGSNRKSVTTFVKVDEGFTGAEAKELFIKALNIDERELPHYAIDVHKYTKGHPFSLSLFVSQLIDFKDDFLTRKDRWDYYINNVLSRQQKRRRSMSDSELFFKPIEQSVNSLDNKIQPLFHQLAVFLEDVNIKSEVLSTLWGLDKMEAEDVMLKFVHKSLAVRKWNELQKSYVYGVHDLIGDYLKKNLTTETEKVLHKDFVESYKRVCRGVWSKLPQDDNYIFYYIGYHLKKAAMNDLFADIYFDLEFLEAKLKVTGPADILRDFKKYKVLISREEKEGYDKILDFVNFIEDYGVWICQGVDIFQAALQTQPSSCVHDIAKKLIMKKFPNQSYLHCKAPLNEKPVPLFLAINNTILAVCFGRSITEAIIASGNGNKLELYSFKTKSVIKQFKGHSGKINCLDLSSTKKLFLSASMDNTIRIWSLDNSETSSGERTPSPHERQESYINFFDNGYSGEMPLVTLEHSQPVTVALFGKKTDHIIAALCMDGSVVMWHDYSVIWEHKDYEFKSIDFCANDELLVSIDAIKIYFLHQKTGEIVKSIEHHCSPFSIVAVSDSTGDGLALLSRHNITFYKDSDAVNYHMDLPAQSDFSKICSSDQRIAATTKDGSLYVLDSESGKQLTYIPSQKQVVSFCVAENAILAGYDGYVFQYPIEALMSLSKLKWSSQFTDPVIAKMDSNGLIDVFVGYKEALKFEADDIEKMDVSEDGKQLVTVNKYGRVLFFSTENNERKSTFILDKRSIPAGLFLLGTGEEQVVVLSYRSCSSESLTLVWRKSDDKLVKLASPPIEYACLIEFENDYHLLTAPPLAVWSLEGQLRGRTELASTCISPKLRLIAVPMHTGLHLCHFARYDGQITWRKKIESTTHIDLLEFSPSGNMLALIETDGSIKVFDIASQLWESMPINTVMKKAVYLAVSDSGTICYGGNGLVCIAKPNGPSTTAVLDVTCIVADPSGADTFAVTDKTGYICKIYQDYFNDGEK